MNGYNLETLLLREKDLGRRLVIPRVQRAYAQGRPEEETVRRLFLRALFDVLRTPRKELVLNYAFGGISGDRFELMDGQQRLTTLFLLHWYLHAGAGAEELEHFDRFIYETRPTSTEFVHHLATTPLPLKDGKPEAPHDFLRNQHWFTRAFELDPTVDGMLTMLEAIHNEMRPEDNVKAMQEQLGNILFYVPDPEYMENPDDQYCKINDRGLPLTPFECFKADLVGHLQGTKGGTDWSGFIKALDFKWLSFFEPEIEGDIAPDDLENLEKRCQELDAETSRRYFRFFFRFCAHRVICGKGKPDSWDFFRSKSEQQTRGKGQINEQVEKYLGFDHYRALPQDTFREMEVVLETLHERALGKNVFAPSWDDSAGAAFFCESGKYTHAQAIIFSAFCDYVLHIGGKVTEKSQWKAELLRWLRIAWNIVENSPDEVETRMRELHELACFAGENYGNDLYTTVAKWENKKDDKIPFKEEIRKAGLISTNPEWENALAEAESHPYLRGMVGFLLDFCGEDLGAFPEYTRVAKEVFDKAQGEKNGFLLERALLATGDYLVHKGDSYYGIYSLSTSKGRGDYSWIGFLKKSPPEKRMLVQKLFAELRNANACEKLKSIIDPSHCEEIWRKLLVQDQRPMEFCSSRDMGFMAWGSNKILLLTKSRTNCYSEELFTYYMQLNHLTDWKLQGIGISKQLPDGRHLLLEAFTDGKDFHHFLLTITQDNGEQKTEVIPLDLDRNFEETVKNVRDRIRELTQEAPANTP